MKLWGGRFTKETNQLVHNFNEFLSSGHSGQFGPRGNVGETGDYFPGR